MRMQLPKQTRVVGVSVLSLYENRKIQAATMMVGGTLSVTWGEGQQYKYYKSLQYPRPYTDSDTGYSPDSNSIASEPMVSRLRVDLYQRRLFQSRSKTSMFLRQASLRRVSISFSGCSEILGALQLRMYYEHQYFKKSRT
jgi:hypothetical protein